MESLTTSREVEEIRRLTCADWIEYRRLRLQALRCIPGSFAGSPASELGFSEGHWRRQLDALLSTVYGLIADDVLWAMATLADSASAQMLTGFYVDSSRRRRGYASRLLRGLLAFADVAVVLAVDKQNVAALSLYQQHGFVVKGEDSTMMNGHKVQTWRMRCEVS
jgi:GNAT superfamily N-acetyltransferase